MKKLKKILYEVVILVFPVMLGVYLGLLVNNWSTEKTENQQTEKALKNILQEINRNDQTVEQSLHYFRQLGDSIYQLENRTFLPANFTFWKGLNPPLLKDASFQSAALSGVLGRLDFDLLEQLTTLYKLQADLELQSNTYFQSITNRIGNDNFTNEQYLIILENYAHDQVSSEEVLWEELKKTEQIISDFLDTL